MMSSLLGGAVVFIAMALLKKVQGERINRMELLKVALIVTGTIFIILSARVEPKSAVLSEPFTSSLES